MKRKPKLTPKMKLFVQEYLVDLVASAAAIRAGYSQRRAHEIGYQLLRKPAVEEAIQAAMKKREQRIQVTADKVVSELAKIAFSDLRDFVEFGPEVKVHEESGIKVIRSAVLIKPSSEVDGSILAEVSQTPSGIKVKPHDKMKALELLGKHIGMFTEKHSHEVTGKGGRPIEVTHKYADHSDDELERLIAEKLAKVTALRETGDPGPT